jgi:phage terminase large subunit-like protein
MFGVMKLSSSWPPAWLTPTDLQYGSRGADAIDFINTFVTLTKDSIAGSVGELIQLRPWQEQLLNETLALDENGLFRTRTALYGLARKNGKSALMTGMGLWFLFNGDEGGEVYSCAAEKDQARITFGDARKIIEREPELAAMCNIYRDVIEVPSTGSIWRVLSAEAYSKEGLNASAVIFDEVHALPNRELWDVMQLSMASRRQPIMLATTTCGVKADSTGQDSTAYQLYQYGQKIARGEVVDPTFYMAWWQADEADDHRLEETWMKANPGYGDLNSKADFESMVKRTPEAEFRTKRCNQWVSSQNAWLPAGVWDTLAEPNVVVDDMAEMVLGVDGSFSGDTTAIVGVTVPKSADDKPHVFLLGAWEKQPDDLDDWRVDTLEVEQTIIAFCQAHPNVKEIAFDPFRWQRSMAVLQDLGLPVVEYNSTSPRRMIPSTQKVFDSVTEATLTHDGNPLLARHIDNCVLKIDNLGARIVKESRHSPRKIDAAVAFVIAYDRATSKLETMALPEFFSF